MKKLIIFTLVLTVLTVGFGQTAEADIKVSSKSFTEQLILGNMTVMLLEDRGFPVTDKTGIGATSLLRPALNDGSIDMYWEYTGTGLTVVMGEEEIADPKKAWKTVKEWDEENNDIIWLDYAPANNSYGIMVRDQWGEERDIQSISDLAEFINNKPNKVKMATDTEFYERPDGLRKVEEEYDFKFGEPNLVFLEIGLTYNALKNKNADAAMGFGTDGRIKAFDLRMLEDDKNVFPVYNPAPTVRKDTLEEYPDIKKPLREMAKVLDTTTLRNLNRRVDVDEESPEEVAEDFLKEEGLID